MAAHSPGRSLLANPLVLIRLGPPAAREHTCPYDGYGTHCVTSVRERPDLPARAVRPTRCT